MVTDVTVLARRGLRLEQFFAESAARMRRVFAFDAACWHTSDPQTGMMTGAVPDDLVSAGLYTPETVGEAARLIIRSEYLLEDINTFAGLARRRVPVARLSSVVGGSPGRSARYRDLLAPSGIPFEMRAAFVSRGRAWGSVHLARREGTGDFTAEDERALAQLTSVVADGIRTSLRREAAERADAPQAPGMVVLDAHDEIELVTPAAEHILSELHEARPPGGGNVPTAVLALAGVARTHAHPDDRRVHAVAVPTPSGWVTLHASLPDGRTDGRVAIVLERASSPEATAIRLEVHGVTAREREIAALIAQGRSNPEIAEALVLSPYTVQDHIKSLLEKMGVDSRQELVARVFLDDYLPRLGTPLSSRGTFAVNDPPT